MEEVQDMFHNVISLYVKNGGWRAQFHHDREIIELFGTDCIPTAYTTRGGMSPQDVRREIERLNPEKTVRFRQEA